MKATSITATSVEISWTGSTGVTGYEVQYTLDGGRTWIAGTTTGTTTAAVGNLAADMNYMFRVRAVLSEGVSDWSDIAVAKTSPAESAIAAVKPKKVAVAKNGNKPTLTAITLTVLAGES